MSIIDLDDAKSHLNITTGDDDTLIQSEIDAASEWINFYLGKCGLNLITTDPTSYPGPNGTTITVPSSVPPSIAQACRLLVAYLYQNREAALVGASAQAIPFGVRDLLLPFRPFVF